MRQRHHIIEARAKSITSMRSLSPKKPVLDLIVQSNQVGVSCSPSSTCIDAAFSSGVSSVAVFSLTTAGISACRAPNQSINQAINQSRTTSTYGIHNTKSCSVRKTPSQMWTCTNSMAKRCRHQGRQLNDDAQDIACGLKQQCTHSMVYAHCILYECALTA